MGTEIDLSSMGASIFHLTDESEDEKVVFQFVFLLVSDEECLQSVIITT